MKNILLLLLFLSSLTNVYSQKNEIAPEISGLMQIWGKQGLKNNDESAFLMKRMEIKFAGNIIPGKVSYVAMIDPVSKSKFINENGTANHIVNPLQDMFINVNISKAFNISVGQFLLPVTREGLTPSSHLLFGERSNIGRIVGDKRDIGIMLSGGIPFFNYTIAVVNGNGQDNPKDNNNYKDVAFRIVAMPFSLLEIGGYGYLGKNTAKGINSNKNRFGGDIQFSVNKFGLESEFAFMEEYGVKSQGFHASAYYQLFQDLTLATRYEVWDPAKSIENNEITVFSIGGFYYLYNNKNIKIHMDYTLVSGKTQEDIGELLTGIQLTF